MSEVQLADLTLGDTLATGGQGAVMALANDPLTVFKRYHNPADPAFDEGTLAWLVQERSRISSAGNPVDEWAAWPSVLVRDGNRAVGFLMPRVPSEFTLDIGGRPKLADLSFLATEPGPLWADVPLPSDEERVQIVQSLASAMRSLHQRKIVVGDVSFANVIWARTPRPRVMLLDCDGMCHPLRAPVLPQAETLDWDDPMAPPGTPPTLDRDRYKLALAVLRVLNRDLQIRPDPNHRAHLRGLQEPTASAVHQLLADAAGPIGTRPSAADWVTALSARATVPIGKLVPRKIDAPPPKPDLLGGGKRTYRPVTPPKP